MAELNLKYDSGTDSYSDGDAVEEELLRIAERGIPLEEVENPDFPALYHLSKVRENILSWYPFDKESTCLEIGSGCGAITGLLCKKVKKVVSVELSKRRASINYARHKDLDNLELMVGNLNNMEFPEKYDYIVINGVFEYAMSFTPGEHPYEDFLRMVSGFLKRDGVLLIAIENRLGLKYFAGAPEDHTNAYYDGLRNYPGNDSVRTFSKSEWQDLMNLCGMEYYRFYYPYPDYKFPSEIFTDETLVSQKYGRKIWNFTDYRFELFSENEMAATFLKEGIMDRFANSFLIEMSFSPLKEDRIAYAKVNRDRKEDFAIQTIIRDTPGGRQVVKEPLEESAKVHIAEMERVENQETTGLASLVKGVREGDSLVYPWMTGSSLAFDAKAAIDRAEPQEVVKLVEWMAEVCLSQTAEEADYHSEEFAGRFGQRRLAGSQECVCPANIDLILDNLFPEEADREQTKLAIIDGEWFFDFPVPRKFIVWRAINEIYAAYPILEKQLKAREFYAYFSIDDEMREVFEEWGNHFAARYVGSNQLKQFAKPEIGINLEEIRYRMVNENLWDSTLYIDTGKGYSEEEALRCKVSLEEEKQVWRFTLPENRDDIVNLRLDPVQGYPCITSVVCETAGVKLMPANADGQEEEQDLFLTDDPSYQLTWEGQLPSQLIFTGKMRIMSVGEILKRTERPVKKNHFWRRR